MQVGQAPVSLKKEIDGFALNRVQAAIIAESWRLVQVSVWDLLRRRSLSLLLANPNLICICIFGLKVYTITVFCRPKGVTATES